MKLSKLMMVFAMCAVTLTGTAQTKVIAHRGYWKCEGCLLYTSDAADD